MATAIRPKAWQLYRHHMLIDQHVTQLIRRKIPESILCVQVPPRHGKSELISHYTPAWVVATHPEWGVGLASYESNFARSWGRKARATYLEARRNHLPALPPLDKKRDAANDWGPVGFPNGGMFTAGVGGPMTGRGFQVIIVDDPIKNAEQAMSESYRRNLWDWYDSTLETRKEPNGVVIVMQTRWHDQDLIGKLMERGEQDPSLMPKLLDLPALAETEDDALGREMGEALWPSQWPAEELHQVKKAKGPYWWNALYRQKPSQHESAEWPEEYFQDIWADRWPQKFEMSVVALDPSKGTEKGDYSAITFIGLSGGLLWVDADIQRRPSPELVPALYQMQSRHDASAAVVEANSFQHLLLPEFVRYASEKGVLRCELVSMHNTEKKTVRIRRLGGPLSQGKFRFAQNEHTRLLVQQLRDFPLGDFDDGPDSLEMAMRQLHVMLTEQLEGDPVEPGEWRPPSNLGANRF